MKQKHRIEISNLFFKSMRSPDDYPKYYKDTHRYIKGFMLWLIYMGHEVSFSSSESTFIDGKDAFSNGLTKNIFFQLIDRYRRALKRKESVKYNISLAKIYEERHTDKTINDQSKKFIAWLEKQGHNVNFSKTQYTTINGKIVLRDSKLLKIYIELNEEYSKTLENNGTKQECKDD